MRVVKLLWFDEIDWWWKGKRTIARGIDDEIDDMIPVALVKDKKTGTIYYLEPYHQGGGEARVCACLTPKQYQEKLKYIKSLDDR